MHLAVCPAGKVKSNLWWGIFLWVGRMSLHGDSTGARCLCIDRPGLRHGLYGARGICHILLRVGSVGMGGLIGCSTLAAFVGCVGNGLGCVGAAILMPTKLSVCSGVGGMVLWDKVHSFARRLNRISDGSVPIGQGQGSGAIDELGGRGGIDWGLLVEPDTLGRFD